MRDPLPESYTLYQKPISFFLKEPLCSTNFLRIISSLVANLLLIINREAFVLSTSIPLFEGSCGDCFLHEEMNKQDSKTNIKIENLFMLSGYRILAMLIMSENTPAAVTPAPAPYPFIIIGNSL